MRTGPSKAAEAIVAIFLPPACREEVLGDLHERYSSPPRYFRDALRTVPMVILSRMRRTADAQVLLMQALALYLAFVGAAWFADPALLHEQYGLLRLAAPAGAVLVGLMLEDAYARPGRRSHWGFARGPVVGVAIALLTRALPALVMLYGCAMSLLLSLALRMLFPPIANQLQGANAPADWLKLTGEPLAENYSIPRLLRGAVLLVTAVIAWRWIGDLSPNLRPRLNMPALIVVLVVLYLVWKGRQA